MSQQRSLYVKRLWGFGLAVCNTSVVILREGECLWVSACSKNKLTSMLIGQWAEHQKHEGMAESPRST